MHDTGRESHAPAALPGKYLVITIGGESYGIPVTKVRQIVRLLPITPVANMPPHVRGVINLRGRIVPLVDLRRRFGLPVVADHDRTCIVVTEIGGGPVAARRLYALVVDGVEEVARFAAEDIEPPPDFGGVIDARFITGMAKAGSGVRTLIDIDMIAADELAAVVAPADGFPAGSPSPASPPSA
jgi:purine-binding chemotaxis protein CheW